MAQNPNLEILESVVGLLKSLTDELVFIGGCATGLLLTDPAAPPLRVTHDVDVITEVSSLLSYHRFIDRLKECGFTERSDQEGPICRLHNMELILDVMPTEPGILGFGNRWFKEGFTTAIYSHLPSGQKIRILQPPYFLATKIDAFNYRGDGDYLLSQDMEDIISVLDGRQELVGEIHESAPDLKEYLAQSFSKFMDNRDFIDALPGHLLPDPASQARVKLIVERIKLIVSG